MGRMMDRNLAIVLVVVAGAAVAAQSPINGGLGRSVGALQAGFVSSGVSTVSLFLFVTLFGGGFSRLGAHGVTWHYVAGGLLGVVYLVTLLAAVRTLGAAGLIAAVIAGQMSFSVLIDHFGLLGVERNAFSAAKLVGLSLLACGVYLILRK